jgi:hypothetical protein
MVMRELVPAGKSNQGMHLTTPSAAEVKITAVFLLPHVFIVLDLIKHKLYLSC